MRLSKFIAHSVGFAQDEKQRTTISSRKVKINKEICEDFFIQSAYEDEVFIGKKNSSARKKLKFYALK